MTDAPELNTRGVGRPLILSLLGVALISPVPLLAARPDLMPSWLLTPVGGVPLLDWGMLVLMAGMVGVAMLCLTKLDNPDA
jgi:hypothetical protein